MEDRLPRKLAAILYADVAGYSRLTSEDEEGTHRRLSQYLDRVSDEIKHYQGRVVHYAGDAVLADFATATDALACAVSIQKELATRNKDLPEQNRVEFRVGINLGEVIVDRDDIYGDGVNVAARLESLAHPGGICISESVRTAIGKKLSVDYKYLGEQQIKNIAEPVRAYHVLTAPDQPDDGVPHSKEVTRSVAVLPFVNMSGDQEQEYFADGLTEDIITSLSLWRSFPVLSRNSTFTYKNRSVKAQQVAQELGARYILEGSVRKSGNRVRITAELIDGETGHNLWAQNFDRDLEDIFAVQDEITHRISATVVPEFEQTETKRSVRKPPDNLDAWDYYLRGLSFVHKSTKDGNAQAHKMFKKALELEPDYGPALSGISYVLNRDLLLDNVESFERTANECLEAAKRAVDLDESAAISRIELVRALLWCGQHDAAIQEAARAIELNPANALAQGWLGAALCFAGREEEGVPRLENAIELASRDPRNKFFMTHLAVAHLTMGQLERALEAVRPAVQGQTDFIEAPAVIASILGHLDKKQEAQTILNQSGIRSLSSIENRPFWRRYLYSKPKNLVLEGLRKADLDSQEAQTGWSTSLWQSDKPSIAVLPFDNMSNDPEQEFFSDGITEDIITELSREKDLFVIARNSTFAYKGKSVDLRHVARELGVRFILEGSVRRAGTRIRLNAQLIEAENNRHIWAEKYDRALEDVFDVQEELTTTICNTLLQKFRDVDIERAMRRTPKNLAAYDHYLRAFGLVLSLKKSDSEKAMQEARQALELEPDYARAHMILAWAHAYRSWAGWVEDLNEELRLCREAAQKSIKCDKDDFWGYGALAFGELWSGNHERALNAIDQAVALGPNSADSHAMRAVILNFTGNPEQGLDEIALAMRLNPNHPLWYLAAPGRAYFLLEQYEEAIPYVERLVNAGEDVVTWRALLAASYMGANRKKEARAEISALMESAPDISCEFIRARVPIRDERTMEKYMELLSAAGLPD